LKPNESRSAGTQIHGRKHEEALWSYSGSPEGIFVEEWSNLEDGIAHILDKISSKRELIQYYVKNHKTIWWCGHFQSSFDGGPTLSPVLLANLANFGVPLFIDNYFSEG
jgi:hypothetical protein